MTLDKEKLWAEAISRVTSRAIELVSEHPDWSAQECVDLAIGEEVFLNGTPGAIQNPIGIINT